MSSAAVGCQSDLCILEDVQPLLAELGEEIEIELIGVDHPRRAEAEDFVRHLFARRHRAEVSSFSPLLLSYRDARSRRAVVGVRDAAGGFFSEQYLPDQAECLIAGRLGAKVSRADLVEVGNLAVERPGDARWTIAATTVFLYMRGYRWVLFTATRVLINAFRRLGMEPLALLAAQPGMLPDGGRQWGDYYRSTPVVCAGRIASGYEKLRVHIGASQPTLHALLRETAREAAISDTCATSFRGGA